MKYFDIDRSHLPVIAYRINPVDFTLQMHEEFLKQLAEDLTNFPGLVVLLDFTHVKSFSSETRIQQDNWLKKHDGLIRQNMKAMVFVNKSAIMAFMLKGIFLFQKPVVPYHVVSDYHQGLVWARNQAIEKSLA